MFKGKLINKWLFIKRKCKLDFIWGDDEDVGNFFVILEVCLGEGEWLLMIEEVYEVVYKKVK